MIMTLLTYFFEHEGLVTSWYLCNGSFFWIVYEQLSIDEWTALHSRNHYFQVYLTQMIPLNNDNKNYYADTGRICLE